jgi:hypothetical protein
MNSTITTSVKRALGARPKRQWTEPHFDAPFPVDPVELVPLGEYRGRRWFSHALGELEERAGTTTDDDLLLDRPHVVERDAAGVRHYRMFSVHAPGTYAATIAARPSRFEQPLSAPRPVDALATIGLLKGVRGASAIAARFAEKGASWAPSGLFQAPRETAYLHIVASRAAPLLEPYAAGKAPACFACGAEAVTVAVGWPVGLPWCGECNGEVQR